MNAQPKEYKLESRTEAADFNYKALSLLDDTKTKKDRRNTFNPVSGNFIVYVFIASFEGLSFSGEVKAFNDILIVKTDNKQKIIDAYQYTLEWAEPPLSYDLYKANNTGMILTDKLSLEILKFQRAGFIEDREFSESGIIRL